MDVLRTVSDLYVNIFRWAFGLQERCSVELKVGEIAKHEAGVLVNTTGTDVNLLAGTVSYTFLEAGGKGLQEELTQACPSGLKVGGVAQTTGGKLQRKKVFHVVLKQWMNENDEAEQILKDVVIKCLQMASTQKHQSIAFPALGSGFHRFPAKRSADLIFTAAVEFLQRNKKLSLKNITIILHPSDDLLEREFRARWSGLSVEHECSVIKEVVLKKHVGSNQECAIKAIHGDLSQFQTDVLVNTTQADLNLSVGAVSRSLTEAGGPVLQQECLQQHPLGVKPGTVIQTRPGKLKCKKVFHVVLEEWAWRKEENEQAFLSVVTKCLQEASNLKFRAIGFPVLGTGYARYPPETSARLMVQAFVNFFNSTNDTSLKGISIVVHPKDGDIRKIVEDQVEDSKRLASMPKIALKADQSEVAIGKETHIVAGHLVCEKDLLRHAVCANADMGLCNGSGIKYVVLEPEHLFKMTLDDYHYRLAESQLHRYLWKDPDNRHIFQLTKVEHIINPKQNTRFRAAQAKMAEKQIGFEIPVLAFHGTAKENVKSICREGFRQPDHTNLDKNADIRRDGNGIYFTEYPEFALQYAQNSNMLLLCHVLQGKVFTCQDLSLGKHRELGYDSHVDPNGREIVMYDEDCILPCYIVHFEISKTFILKRDPAPGSVEVDVVAAADSGVDVVVAAAPEMGPVALVPYTAEDKAAVLTQLELSQGSNYGNRVQLIHGEIAMQKADVLVNTTGTDVNLLAGTVSYTFLEAGGKGLQEELTRACPSGLKVGGIAQTTGGKLQCQKVFHVVLKQWMNENDGAEQILKDVVIECLETASRQNYTSIAFPALGSGFHRFPGKRSAEIMFAAFEDYLQSNKASSLQTVQIVLHPSNEILTKDFEARRDGLAVIQQHVCSTETVLKKIIGPEKEFTVTIRAIIGDLSRLEADVLVNTTQTDLDLSVGAVSRALLEAGGQILQDECSQQYAKGVEPNTVIQTQGGGLQCRKVFHAVLEGWDQKSDTKEVAFVSVVNTCLQEMSKQKHRSIGFPVLGTGFAGYPAEKSAKLMMKAFMDFVNNATETSLEVISIVVHPKDDEVRKVVEKQVGEDRANKANVIQKADGSKIDVGVDTNLVAGHLVSKEDLLSKCVYVKGEKEALAGTEVKYFELQPERLHSMTPEDYHYRLVESQFYRYLSKDDVNRHVFEITKVEYVVNPKQTRRFSKAQERMKQKQAGTEVPVLAFHGTAEGNVKGICEEGFRQPNHPYFNEANDVGWYGNGIYFSEYPRFAMNYMQISKMLLVCKVLQGKIFKCKKLKLGGAKEPGYDSHVDPFGKEIVIYEDDYILPCYIVHFNILRRFRFKEDRHVPQHNDETEEQFLLEMEMHKGEITP